MRDIPRDELTKIMNYMTKKFGPQNKIKFLYNNSFR